MKGDKGMRLWGKRGRKRWNEKGLGHGIPKVAGSGRNRRTHNIAYNVVHAYLVKIK